MLNRLVVRGLAIAMAHCLLPLTGSFPAVTDHYGTIRLAGAPGLMYAPETGSTKEITRVAVENEGGIVWTTPACEFSVESPDHHGAQFEMSGPDEYTLVSGNVDAAARTTITVRIGEMRIRILGRAILNHIPDVESRVQVMDGFAEIRTPDRRLTLQPMDAVRISPAGKLISDRLLPPPELVPPLPYVTAPLGLTIELADEKILGGAILIECSTRARFWAGANKFLFRPAEPAVLTDLPEGRIYIRASTVNRAGWAGPAGRVHATTVLHKSPEISVGHMFQSVAIQGQISPPLQGVDIRWDNLHTLSDSNGLFAFTPDRPFGLTVADLTVDAGGGVPIGRKPLIFLSDPDRLAYVLPYSGDGNQSTLFIRAPEIAARNAALDQDTRIVVPATVRRTLRVDTFELAIFQDVEGPRILNVGLETRGDADKFFVLADVVDLGIGLSLPARAIFQSESGRKLDVPLTRVSELRLEGRASLEALQPFKKARTRVWWVRIEAEDLLGNASQFEKTVVHKRHRKLVPVGVKDLVQILKEKEKQILRPK